MYIYLVHSFFFCWLENNQVVSRRSTHGLPLATVGRERFRLHPKRASVQSEEECEKTEEAKLIKKEVPAKKLGHIIVNDQYKVLFCYISTVACTNIKRVFLNLTGQMNTTNPLALKSKDVHMSLDKYLTYLDLYSNEEAAEKLRRYRKLIFVREPLERLLSAYQNKFIEKKCLFS